ncbi:reverse transcriptase-like protein [Gracilibacillus salitolerans]|uniref:Reverse transcriptase-like protein n=1 Tax=Gracilibacillus salitolerans TaxID=2663022 RepID=A0A5Q2TIL5_9BACI|nr:ribonuclease HI family protein [Gracilibacillus salitolerans]QGH34739.1 reverse transcriptase-like protein [Gracilibacillus salitolerans]
MIEVYTDAASQGNPGPSGIGIYIKSGQQQMEEYLFIGDYSNHEAEFIAVIKALELCNERFPDEIISFRSDAKVVVDAIEKKYVKNNIFQSYLNQINQLSSSFPYFFIKWIPEKQNKHADELARKALQLNN